MTKWDSAVRIRTIKFWCTNNLSSLVPLHVQKKLVALWNVHSLRAYLEKLPAACGDVIMLVATGYQHTNNRVVVNGWIHLDSLEALPPETIYVCFASQCDDVARALGVRVLRVFYADSPTFLPPDTVAAAWGIPGLNNAAQLRAAMSKVLTDAGMPQLSSGHVQCYVMQSFHDYASEAEQQERARRNWEGVQQSLKKRASASGNRNALTRHSLGPIAYQKQVSASEPTTGSTSGVAVHAAGPATLTDPVEAPARAKPAAGHGHRRSFSSPPLHLFGMSSMGSMGSSGSCAEPQRSGPSVIASVHIPTAGHTLLGAAPPSQHPQPPAVAVAPQAQPAALQPAAQLKLKPGKPPRHPGKGLLALLPDVLQQDLALMQHAAPIVAHMHVTHEGAHERAAEDTSGPLMLSPIMSVTSAQGSHGGAKPAVKQAAVVEEGIRVECKVCRDKHDCGCAEGTCRHSVGTLGTTDAPRGSPNMQQDASSMSHGHVPGIVGQSTRVTMQAHSRSWRRGLQVVPSWCIGGHATALEGAAAQGEQGGASSCVALASTIPSQQGSQESATLVGSMPLISSNVAVAPGSTSNRKGEACATFVSDRDSAQGSGVQAMGSARFTNPAPLQIPRAGSSGVGDTPHTIASTGSLPQQQPTPALPQQALQDSQVAQPPPLPPQPSEIHPMRQQQEEHPMVAADMSPAGPHTKLGRGSLAKLMGHICKAVQLRTKQLRHATPTLGVPFRSTSTQMDSRTSTPLLSPRTSASVAASLKHKAASVLKALRVQHSIPRTGFGASWQLLEAVQQLPPGIDVYVQVVSVPAQQGKAAPTIMPRMLQQALSLGKRGIQGLRISLKADGLRASLGLPRGTLANAGADACEHGGAGTPVASNRWGKDGKARARTPHASSLAHAAADSVETKRGARRLTR